jgi:hypothetical protein
MSQDDEDDATASSASQQLQQPQLPSSSTLLPSPVANAVSLITRSSSLYLRLGSFIGSLAIDGARVTTLTGLELSRAVIEGILSRAGSDVVERSRGDLGKADAEGLLERSITTLHSTITQISFAASTSFHFSSAALSSASDISQHLLSILDSILGSTDSSRAIASIITLIRREFQNPATGVQGEKVGVVDLLIGICGLALLQRWSAKIPVLAGKERDYEEVLWDFVILDDGRKADVVDGEESVTSQAVGAHEHRIGEPMSFMTVSRNEELLHTVQRASVENDEASQDWPEESLKRRIMQNLPANANVSITTSTTTTKTITVEVTGAQPQDLTPPPGVEIIEQNAHHAGSVDLDDSILSDDEKPDLMVPKYRVVYRMIRESMRGTDIKAKADHSDQTRIVEDTSDASDIGKELSQNKRNVITLASPLSSPVKEDFPDLQMRLTNHFGELKGQDQSDDEKSLPASPIEQPKSPTNESAQMNRKESAIPKAVAGNTANQKRTRKPMSSASSVSSNDNLQIQKGSGSKPSSTKKPKVEEPAKKIERKGTLRNALKKGSGTTLSNLWSKDGTVGDVTASKEKKTVLQKPAWGASKSKSFIFCDSPGCPPCKCSRIKQRATDSRHAGIVIANILRLNINPEAEARSSSS